VFSFGGIVALFVREFSVSFILAFLYDFFSDILFPDFVIFILRQVDELCENIRNGDPDLERTLEVNQNLNNAVYYYRSKLDQKKHVLIDSDQNADVGIESDDENEEK